MPYFFCQFIFPTIVAIQNDIMLFFIVKSVKKARNKSQCCQNSFSSRDFFCGLSLWKSSQTCVDYSTSFNNTMIINDFCTFWLSKLKLTNMLTKSQNVLTIFFKKTEFITQSLPWPNLWINAKKGNKNRITLRYQVTSISSLFVPPSVRVPTFVWWVALIPK